MAKTNNLSSDQVPTKYDINQKPPWCSGYVIRLVNQGRRFDPGLLQSVGWDYKPRSRLHMTLAVGRKLNPN